MEVGEKDSDEDNTNKNESTSPSQFYSLPSEEVENFFNGIESKVYV